MIDKQILRTRFEANYNTYDLFATVQESICLQLNSKLEKLQLAPEKILEVGAGTGLLTKRLKQLYPTAKMVINDLSPMTEEFISKYATGTEIFNIGDAEQIDLGSGYDLVASSSAVQWFVDLKAFFQKTKAAMRSGGVLALSTFGNNNFTEIKQLTGSGLDYVPFTELKELIKSLGFEIIDSVEYCHTMYFDSPLEVLKHIKATGVNSLHRQVWTPGRLRRFVDDYKQIFSDENDSVKLTYHPIILICKNAAEQ